MRVTSPALALYSDVALDYVHGYADMVDPTGFDGLPGKPGPAGVAGVQGLSGEPGHNGTPGQVRITYDAER